MSVLNDIESQRARKAATTARAFCEAAGYPLGVAMIDEAWFGGDARTVMDALSAYQNPDGGYGNGLEVDIASPASNPFAARLAMQVLLSFRQRPQPSELEPLAAWLAVNQSPDGDWHFSAETRAGDLAPWFASWEFPSLNPACCVAGIADRLGIATPTMLARVATLFAERASIDDLLGDSFYTLLPYTEYVGVTGLADRNLWLDRVTTAIARIDAQDGYDDSQHYFDLALGSGTLILDRLDPDRIRANGVKLLETQSKDGGWPSPYSEAWRPWLTATTCVVLSRLALAAGSSLPA